MTTRGRLTIPKHLRERYGIEKGDEVQLIPLEDGIRIEKLERGTHPVTSAVRGRAMMRDQ